LASAEQTLSDMTTTVLEPLLKFIKMLTNYFNGFTFQTHVVEPFFKGLKSLFAKLPYVGWAFEDNSPPNTPKPNPINRENSDDINSTP
ncbi:DUF759 family protein, partial [Borreliella lanei]